MGKIITLHEDYEEFTEEIYINTNYIIDFQKSSTNKNVTNLNILCGSYHITVEVTETPEEIMKLINGEE